MICTCAPFLCLPGPARAASAPVPVSSVRVVSKASSSKRVAAIPLATIEGFASKLAGVPVTISCENDAEIHAAGADDDDGYTLYSQDWTTGVMVPVFAPVIHLRVVLCDLLAHLSTPVLRDPPAFWTFHGARYLPQDGDALLTLIHETQHIALDSADECLVEQTALANAWQLVRLFKLPAFEVPWLLTGMAEADAELGAAYHPTAGVC